MAQGGAGGRKVSVPLALAAGTADIVWASSVQVAAVLRWDGSMTSV